MVTPADDPYAPTTPGSKPAAGKTSSVPGLVGRRLGDYEILEPLGEGGMGVVYRAKDATLDREVALKVLQPYLAQDSEYELRFIREAKTAAKLDHPNVVAVYAAGRAENVLFMAMQLVRGRTLHQVLRERKRLPVGEALSIVRQAAEGLEAAHRAGLVHRDIKPNNIMVDAEGRVKIMDFGLMRSKMGGEAITQRGDFFGTPEYASPEQCETSELDGRSDLYSLGVVLYEMLAGRMPHKADTPMALFKKILHDKPRALRLLNPEVPPAVEALVAKLMAKSPADRFASGAELAEEIRRVEQGGGPVRRSKVPMAVLGLAGAAVLALGAVLWVRSSQGTEAKPAVPSAAVRPAAKIERFKLAVLDFRNGTPDAATNWYEIALSDLMIASLAQFPGVEVPSRETLMWAHGGAKETVDATDAERLARGLGATGYVTGKYYVRGGKIRVTLTGYRLPGREPLFGTRSFEKAEGDVFALVDEAARTIAKDLEGLAAPGAGFSASADVKPCLEVAQAWRHDAPVEELAKAKGEKNDKDGSDRVLALAEPRKAGAAERGLDEKKAERAADAPRQQDKPASSAPAAAPPAPHAQKELRRTGTLAAMSDPELAKAWYQNRHALEECNFKKDDFDALTNSLRAQFQAGPTDAVALQKGVENFRGGIDHLRESKLKGGFGGPARPAIEFVCPGCNHVSGEFARCEMCDRYLVLRIKLPGTAPEKKKE
jgi:TolB-like protein